MDDVYLRLMFFGGSNVGGTSGIEQNFVGKKFILEIVMGWHIADVMDRCGIDVEKEVRIPMMSFGILMPISLLLRPVPNLRNFVDDSEELSVNAARTSKVKLV
ncbi:hypothetical protein QTP88_005755 [Uroleucon formosanum]